MEVVPIDELLPHRPPMRFLDELLSVDETSARARARFEEGHPAVDKGQVLETALVECVAQTVAAAEGFRRRTGRAGGQTGMLTGVRDFTVTRAPRAGQSLDIEIRESKRWEPFLLVEGRISAGGEAVAAGELTLYLEATDGNGGS